MQRQPLLAYLLQYAVSQSVCLSVNTCTSKREADKLQTTIDSDNYYAFYLLH